MSGSIKGWCEEHAFKSEQVKILYLPCNKSQYEMAVIYAENSKHKSFIYATDFEIDARTYIALNPDSKARFILSRNSAASLLPAMDRVVVFVGSVTPFISKDVNEIVSTCLKVKKPVVEVPHGLFQSGYNLLDNSKLIHTSSNELGFGEPLPSISNYKIRWYGDEGVGYPRTVLKDSLASRELPKFTLVTTNTNWYLYSMTDKRSFFKVLFDYAKSKESEMFIWCPHPAEFVPETFSFNAIDFRPNNILLYGMDNDIYFNGLEGSDDLIPYCEYGISTLSTCLLDYEIYKKRVNVFSCTGVNDILSKMPTATKFVNYKDISQDAEIIETGYLKQFDADKFDSLLTAVVDDSSFVSHHYLSSFI